MTKGYKVTSNDVCQRTKKREDGAILKLQQLGRRKDKLKEGNNSSLILQQAFGIPLLMRYNNTY